MNRIIPLVVALMLMDLPLLILGARKECKCDLTYNYGGGTTAWSHFPDVHVEHGKSYGWGWLRRCRKLNDCQDQCYNNIAAAVHGNISPPDRDGADFLCQKWKSTLKIYIYNEFTKLPSKCGGTSHAKLGPLCCEHTGDNSWKATFPCY